jgi:hypothetical protein
MKHFHIHCPGMAYAADEYASNKKEALSQYRKRWGLSRMPQGFSIWES